MSPRPQGPVQINARRVARVAGDMSLAIIRQDAPRDRVRRWVRDLRDAADDLELNFVPRGEDPPGCGS